MTNADYIRSKLTDNQPAERLDTDNCRKCKARKICKEKYPDGVWKDFDCKRLIKKWLKQEKIDESNSY